MQLADLPHAGPGDGAASKDLAGLVQHKLRDPAATSDCQPQKEAARKEGRGCNRRGAPGGQKLEKSNRPSKVRLLLVKGHVIHLVGDVLKPVLNGLDLHSPPIATRY